MRDMAYKYEPKEGWAAYIARQRAARVAAGLCRACKQPAAPGKTRCEYHIAYEKAYRRAGQDVRNEERTGFRRRVVIYLTDEETKVIEEFGDPASVLKSMAFQNLKFLKEVKETVEP